MKNAYWYAVLAHSDDNDWGYGSYDYDEAVKMVQPYIADGGYIAVIGNAETDDPFCVDEIREF